MVSDSGFQQRGGVRQRFTQREIEPSSTHFSLIGELQDIQQQVGYLPRMRLKRLSQRSSIPLSRIYGIATFYDQFSMQPNGDHLITVCTGTACHVRGAPEIVEKLENALSIKTGETSENGRFTLETVNCLGACALAPLISIDGTYYGNMTIEKVDRVLEKYDVLRN